MNGDESGEGWALSIRDKFYETIFLKPGRYMAHCQYFCSFDGVQGAGFKGTAVAYRHNTINPPLTGFNSNLHTLSRGFPPYSRKYGAGNTITSNAKIQFMRSRNNDDDMGGSTVMLDFQVEDEAASIGGVAGAAVPVTLRMTMLGTGGECHINLVGCYIQKIGEL
jgi:hypothetical protein